MKIIYNAACYISHTIGVAFLALAACPTLAAPTCTTACYISPTGNDANSGDIVAPLATIQIAINQVNSGGTVFLAAGAYTQASLIDKNITLSGAGQALVTIQGAGLGNGISIVSSRTNTVIEGITITGFYCGISFADTNPNNATSCSQGAGNYTNITLRNLTTNNNLGNGIQISNTPSTLIDGVLVSSVTANNNGSAGKPNRGIWLLGDQRNVTIENSTFNNNLLVGIDFNSGIRSGTIVRNNTVVGNADSGIGLIGVVESFVAPTGGRITLVENNIVTNNGRFGIEIKNPSGNGLNVGTGSVVVRGNRVTRTLAATDLRDYAGIAVFRRAVAVSPGGATEPTGVWLENNLVAGYIRNPAAAGPGQGMTRDAFGMLIEGTNHTITNNVLQNNNIGLQIQAGGPNAPGDSPSANATPQTQYFDRGNATTLGMITVTNNGFVGNTDFGLRKWETSGAGTTIINANQNFWGSANGPAPIGTGDAYVSGVAGNMSVIVTDWLTSPSPIVAAMLGIVAPPPPPPPTAPTNLYCTASTTVLGNGSLTCIYAQSISVNANPIQSYRLYCLSTTGVALQTTVAANEQQATITNAPVGRYTCTLTAQASTSASAQSNEARVALHTVPLALRNQINIDAAGFANIYLKSAVTSSAMIGRFDGTRFTFTPIADVGDAWNVLGAGDITGSNRSSLISRNALEDIRLDVNTTISQNPTFATTIIRKAKIDWKLESVVDLDGDGKADMLWRYTKPGSNDSGVIFAWYMASNDQASLNVNEVKHRGGAPLTWSLIDSADLDGDGKADILWLSPSNEIRSLTSKIGRTWVNERIGQLPVDYSVVKLGDMNADGKGDFIFKDATGRIKVWLMNGVNIALDVDMHSIAASTSFYAAGDFDGDGTMDIVWKKADGSLLLWLMNPAVINQPTVIDGAGMAPSGFVVIE